MKAASLDYLLMRIYLGVKCSEKVIVFQLREWKRIREFSPSLAAPPTTQNCVGIPLVLAVRSLLYYRERFERDLLAVSKRPDLGVGVKNVVLG